MGLKQYLHGTTYNGGNAPTVTSGQAGFAVNRANFTPYQMQDGTWRLRFNIAASFTSATLATVSLGINGITTKNVSNYRQATAVEIPGVSSATAGMSSNGNAVSAFFPGSSVSGINVSGDIELNAKPTWAY
jgi:hypothetical protein